MYLMPVVVANFGRGETDKVFIASVHRMVNTIIETLPKRFQQDPELAFKKAVVGISELDEADKPQEHKLFKQVLKEEVGNFHTAGWWTMNPIVCGAGLKMEDESVRAVANSSVPHLSPKRQIVSCEVENAHPKSKVDPIGIINHHAAIRKPGTAVSINNTRRAHHATVVDFQVVQRMSGITMGDWNDPNYPFWPGIESAVHGGLDYIRFWNVKDGAQLEPIGSASFPIRIDPHKGHVCVFAVS